jgi:hypothetical protein
MTTSRKLLAVPLAAAAALALACSDGPDGPGQLSVSLSALSAPAAVDAVWVNVTAVRAHTASGGWTTLSSAPARVNLLALQDHALDLGLATLPAGEVTQLRLVLEQEGNVVVQGTAELPLTIPSGYTSGIKIHGPWTIDSCTETAVALGLDGELSIAYHATGAGEWILRPVIRTARVEHVPGTCEEPTPAPTCVAAECGSGRCDVLNDRCAPGGASTPCAANADCLSGACVEAVCAPGAVGAACAVPADCAAGLACVEGGCEVAAAPL